MAREMYLAGISEEMLRPDPKPEGPKTPKGKWENYWYHYKWHTIAAIAVVLVLTVLIVQMASKDDPDYTLTLVTENVMGEPALKALQAELEKAGADVDKDGKVEVRVDNIYLGGQGQMQMVNAQKLMVQFSAGEAMLLAFEPKYYEQYVTANEKDGFHFFTDLGLPDDVRYWNWENAPVRQTEVLKTLPKKLYFGVRATAGTASKKQQQHDEALALLQTFMKNP